MQSGISVILAPEQITSFWGIPITNTLITSWVAIAILIIVAFIVRSRLSYTPGRFQLLLESLVIYVQDFVKETLEDDKWSRRVFPLLITIFLFIATSNIIEFTPGIGSIGFFSVSGAFTPLLRSVNTDLNVTLTLAIISVISIEIIGIIAVGFWRYAGKFINFTSPLNFVVGLIELVSELSRFVSFSFRLFGNIFAGEVLIAVVSYFVPYVVPAPLMAFEMFVGFVQAAVFALLTLFFIKLAITDPHAAH
jgi:F-type H+-transporting ATPase subunit a